MLYSKHMSDIIVIAFRHPDAALQVAAQFQYLEAQHALRLIDARVVVKDREERLHVKDVAGHPMAMGALVGGLLGALVGAAAGGVVGKLTSSDLVDAQFVDDVAQALRPDSSAVFLQVDRANTDAVITALRAFRGTLIQTTVPPEMEEELKRALAPYKPRAKSRT